MQTIKLSQQKMYEKNLGTILFYVLASILIVVYLVYQPELMLLEPTQKLSGYYESKFTAYLVSFAVMLLCALTPLPAELIALTNTFIYSPFEAFMVTWLSAVLSAQIGYEFGRLNGIDPCKYEDSNKICLWLNVYGYKALAIMRLIPIVPFFALNICGGIFKLERCKYTMITAVTIIPAVFLLTLFPQLFL